MLFWAIAAKNLTRRPSRTLLTVLGMTVSVAATTSLVSIAWGFARSSANHYTTRGVDIVVVRAGVAQRITSSLKATLAGRLGEVNGVAKVEGALLEMVSLGGGSLIGIPLHGLDPTGFAITQFEVASGRSLRPGEPAEVLLGAGLARALGKSPGDDVAIEGEPFQVVGIFHGRDALEANTALTSLAALQRLMDRPEQVSEFRIELQPPRTPARFQEVIQALERLRDEQQQPLGLRAMATRDFVASDTQTQLLTGMAWGTALIALSLAILGILNTMLMSVLERTRDFGILRAIGWSRRRVIRLILLEALALSAGSAALGVVAAWIVLQALARWSFTSALVLPELSPTAASLGAAAALLAGVGGAIYPAWRASGVSPVEALRYE